jgi:hypothetical protein
MRVRDLIRELEGADQDDEVMVSVPGNRSLSSEHDPTMTLILPTLCVERGKSFEGRSWIRIVGTLFWGQNEDAEVGR